MIARKPQEEVCHLQHSLSRRARLGEAQFMLSLRAVAEANGVVEKHLRRLTRRCRVRFRC